MAVHLQVGGQLYPPGQGVLSADSITVVESAYVTIGVLFALGYIPCKIPNDLQTQGSLSVGESQVLRGDVMIHVTLLTGIEALDPRQVNILHVVVCRLALQYPLLVGGQVTIPVEARLAVPVASDVLWAVGIYASRRIVGKAIGHQIVKEVDIRLQPDARTESASRYLQMNVVTNG